MLKFKYISTQHAMDKLIILIIYLFAELGFYRNLKKPVHLKQNQYFLA